MLKYLLLYFIFFMLNANVFAQWMQVGDDIAGQVQSGLGSSTCISNDGTIIAIGSPYADENGMNSGMVSIYKISDGNWEQIGQNIIGDGSQYLFGNSISISNDGQIIAIGANGYSSVGNPNGQVKIYKNVLNNWEQIGTTLIGSQSNIGFGFSVDLNGEGTRLAVGSPYKKIGTLTMAGQVKVYENISNTWTQIGLDINGETKYNKLGSSLSFNNNGTILAIGAPHPIESINDTGKVRVLQYISNNWELVNDVIIGQTDHDYFGASVDLSANGTTLVVGAPQDSTTGSENGVVKVFRNISNQWAQVGQSIYGTNNLNNLGNKVSINSDGSIIAISSPESNLLEGTRVYRNELNNWEQITQEMFLENTRSTSICIDSSGNTIIIGAPGYGYDGGLGSPYGKVRVYGSTCYPMDYFSLPNDTIICDNTTLELFGIEGGSNLWSNGDTTFSTIVTDSGYVYLTISTDSCLLEDSIHIGYKTAPNVSFTVDSMLICIYDSLTASISDDYTWNTGGTSQSILPENDGNYAVTLSNTNNCYAEEEIYITHSISPTNLEDSVYYCNNDELTIYVNPENENIWNGSYPSDSILYTATTDTIYYLQATDTNNCLTHDSVLLFSTASFAYSFIDNEYNFIAESSLNLNYTWSFGDGDTAVGQSVNHVYQTQGNYEVCLYTHNDCLDTICKNINIACAQDLYFYLPTDTFVYPNQDYTFEITDLFQTYSWSNGGTTNNTVIYYDSLSNPINNISVFVSVDSTCTISQDFTIEKYPCQNYSVLAYSSDLIGNTVYTRPNEIETFNVEDIDFYENNNFYTQTQAQLQFFWDFSDGSALHVGDNISHICTLEGVFKVRLFAKDQYNCESDLDSSLSISVNNFTFDSVSVSPFEICIGECVDLFSSAENDTIFNIPMSNNFNLDIMGNGWTSNCSPSFNNPCTTTSDNWDGTTYLWVGAMSTFPRDLTTIPYNLSDQCQICFDLKLGTQGYSSPCEGPDEMDEGVSLQYMTANDTLWQDIIYFCPDGNLYPNNLWVGQSDNAGGSSGPFIVWGNYCFDVPVAAISDSTKFRWHQEQVTSETYDHWGLDNIVLDCGQFVTSVNWYDGNNTEIYGNTGSFQQCPTQNAIYSAVISNGVYADTSMFNVIVNSLPSVWLGNDTTLCYGDTLNLNAGNFESYIWNDMSLNQYLNINTAGQYYVEVSDINNCKNTDTINIYIEVCTNTYSNSHNNFIKIYPNPATNTLVVESSEKMNTIEILDITGQTVKKSLINRMYYSIDIDNLEKGVYFIKINKGNLYKLIKE